MEDRRNVGENSCNFGDGTDQRVQSFTFFMMMMMMMMMKNVGFSCPAAKQKTNLIEGPLVNGNVGYYLMGQLIAIIRMINT